MLIHENKSTLHSLHLSEFPGRIFKSAVLKCVQLKELGFWNARFKNEKEISYIINNIPLTVEKLQLGGYASMIHHIEDSHIKVLVDRCKNLKSFAVGITKATEKSLNYITRKLKFLEVLDIHFRVKDLDFDKLLLLPKLKRFVCRYKDHGDSMTEEEKESLKLQLPNLKKIEHNATRAILTLKFM